MRAEQSGIDVSKAVFQVPAKLISDHHLQDSEGPSDPLRETGCEFPEKKTKEIDSPCS